ncbi:hypothetical protein AB1P65_09350 [Roseibium alexandrii]
MNDDPYFHGCYPTQDSARDSFVIPACWFVGGIGLGSLLTQAVGLF